MVKENQIIATLREQNKELMELIKELREEISALRKGKQGQMEAPSPKNQNDTKPNAGAQGWETQDKRKKSGKKRSDKQVATPPTKEATEPQAPKLKLRAEDWNLTVGEGKDFHDGAGVVALLAQDAGERIYADLKGASGNMGMLTPRIISDAGERSKLIEVKAINEHGRLVLLKRFLTTIGEYTQIRPTSESSKMKTAETLDLVNNTVKVVLKVAKIPCKAALFARAKASPLTEVTKYLVQKELRDKVLFSTRPLHKEIKGSEWIESILTVKMEHLKTFHKLSGEAGVFFSIFREGNDIEKQWRIAKFAEDTTLDQALEKNNHYATASHGLVLGPWGIGMRLATNNFIDNVQKIFGEAAAAKEREKQGQKFYEISKIPPWVDFAAIKSKLEEKLEWATTLVRVIKGWNTKTFIVRSSNPPPRDTAIIADHRVLIQAARERQAPVKQVKGLKVRGSNPAASRTTATRTIVVERPQHQEIAPTVGDDIKGMLEGFMKSVNARLDEFAEQLATWDNEGDQDMEEDAEGDGEMTTPTQELQMLVDSGKTKARSGDSTLGAAKEKKQKKNNNE